MKNKLAIFEKNDIDSLFVIATQLFRRRALDYFLTAQQLAVLEQIFTFQGSKKALFSAFLEGKLYLRFIDTPKTEVEEQPSEKEKESDSKDENEKERDEEIVEVTVPEGVDSARALALKIRYILWDKAIDLYYDQEDAEEYEIFEQDCEKVETQLEARPETVRNVAEDDDYDDDEEEPVGVQNQVQSSTDSVQLEIDESGNTVLEVPIVSSSETTQFDNKKLIENFNKIYHNFENDKDTLIKRRKLEENDKLLEGDNSNSIDLISMNLGAANLSLKHLLHAIDDSKDKLQLPDNELRQLIMDVRKNRSKWASDDKIGQEELYEACEKVVLELRNYTEHSTAFLNKVSKREAPNYYQIIKKPMDLNTILKKLKAFQYSSKADFVEDAMLIWKNCLTYNSDPRHFLRAHAIAMQKKSLQLLPLIPDITVRDRAEVETESQAEEPATPAPHGKTSSKKGKKRTSNGEVKDESQNAPSSEGPIAYAKAETPAVATSLSTNGVNMGGAAAPAGNNSLLNDAMEMEDDDNVETNEYLNTEDNDKDDLEIQTWKNLTSKTRSDFCMKRAELFKDNELNSHSDAILRDPKRMRNYESYLKSYTETKKHIFNSSNKPNEEEPYLIEYDITGGLPALPYSGMSEEEVEQYESKLAEEVMSEGLKPSELAPRNGGLNLVINNNINEMQEIRKICFKISLIRQMQQQQFVHHTQLKAPEIEKIDDSVDIDPVSRLENHDKMNKELMFYVMKKRISKIAMQSGFESTEMFAIDTLTQVAGDYMDNLVKTIKQHLETPSVNQFQKERNILTLSLLQNGIRKPDDLHTYVTENVLKQHVKLQDLKTKLSAFLKQLLRPAFEMNEKTFGDNSEQFLSGDFSNEIGEDFFGFKELGLDKELGMVGNTIPLHLLQSRLAESHAVDDEQKVQREEFESAPLLRIKENEIESQIKLFQSFLRECLEKTKLFNSKQYKTKKESADYLASASDVVIMEDDDYPKKSSRAKLPPTGKITATKKKITALTFFSPESEVKQEDVLNHIPISNNV
jgi:transcriptional activator SPT7